MNKDSLMSTDVLERSFNVSRDFTFDLDLIRAAAETDPIFLAVWQRATKYAGCEEKEESVPLEDFVVAFFKEIKDVHTDTIDQLCLATIITDLNPESRGEEDILSSAPPTVSKVSFALYLLYYGPASSSLAKIRDAVIKGQSWFHGQQTRETSDHLLQAQRKEKLFLLRYSSTPGAFTVDYVKGGKMCHFNNIRNDPEGGVSVTIGQQPKQQVYKYSNLSAFIAKNVHIFGEPCVNHNSQFQWRKLHIGSDGGSFKNLSEFLRTTSSSASPLMRSRSLSHHSPSTDGDSSGDEEHEGGGKGSGKKDKKKKKKRKDPKHKKERRRSASSKISPRDIIGVARRKKSEPNAVVEAEVEAAIEAAAQTNPKALDLRRMRLTSDSIPTSVVKLTHLVRLDLAHNCLTELPDNLALLINLRSIDLTGNKLTSLNSHVFASWLKLNSLICADNLLTELPAALFEGTRKKLAHIDLSSNQLTSIPASIARLKHKLLFLDLSSNLLQSIPKSITKLRILEELYLKQNRLKKLLPGMTSMISLMVFDVSQNDLSDIPHDLYDLIWANPGFVFIVDGNASIDPQEVETIIASGGTDPKIKKLGSKVDMFSAYNISIDKDDEQAIPNISQGLYVQTNYASINPGFHTLWTASDQYYLEMPLSSSTRPDPELYEHFNIYDYRRYFYRISVHTNILGTVKGVGPVCISILKEPSTCHQPNPKEVTCYRALMRTVFGDKQIEIPASMVKRHKKERYARSADLLMSLKKYLNHSDNVKSLCLPITEKFSVSGLYVVRDAMSHNKFAALEDQLKIGSYKFGILYAKQGQTDETSMYNNAAGSEGFEEFLNLLGSKIELEGWQGYTGGLETNVAQKAIYTEYSGHEVLFHVCTYLPLMKKTDKLAQQWDRKRHIGNDVCVIVYYDGTDPIDPATFESQFNHVFALVQPTEEKDTKYYRLHMAYKQGVDPSIQAHPSIPRTGLFERGEYFRDFLLAKMINAERCSVVAPRFQNPTQRVRRVLFEEMQERFPKRKDKKTLLGRKKSYAILFGAPPLTHQGSDEVANTYYGDTSGQFADVQESDP